MLEVELQKLTAAITALTEELRSAKVGNSLPTQTPTNSDSRSQPLEDAQTIPTNSDKLRQDDQSYRNDDAARVALQAERDRRQAELDQQMAEVYKAEQAKAKRKAKVTKEETEALIEAVTDNSSKSPEPAIISANITEGDLKTMALEIARADSSARPIILGILAEHDAKTITQLDPKHYRAVHGRLLSLAHDIAKNGEPV